MTFFGATWALFKKECLLQARQPASLLPMFFFSFLALLILKLGFGEGEGAVPWVPLVWATTLFGGMLRLTRSFDAEEEGDLLDHLRILPGIAGPLFLSKWILNFLFILLLEIATLAFAGIFSAIPLTELSQAVPAFLLGTLGLSCVGTLMAGMFVGEGRRDLLLPILAYPILVPVILGVLHGAALDITWLKVLASFDVIFATASFMVFEQILKG